MIEINLKYNLYHQWLQQDAVFIIGKAFKDGQLLTKTDLAALFHTVKNEAAFLQALAEIDGHFAIVLETDTTYFVAVDRIRTFPIFLKNNNQNIQITDSIVFNGDTRNEAAIEYFKHTYCTLENTTLLKEWQQLQAGQYAVITKNNKKYYIKNYYKHTAIIQNTSTEKRVEQLKESEKALVEKIWKYADGRTIVIPLSGGYDSRYLLAVLKQSNYPNIECFTYGKTDSFEVLTAKKVCEQLQVKWHFVEYDDELLKLFFTEKWQQYASLNHHYTSLPHEQDFFALHYLKERNIIPKEAVIMNGFCQDIHSGSYLEEKKKFNLYNHIFEKHAIKPILSAYENNWMGYREWLIKNRLSKFIINSVRVYEYFGWDFYLPFWQKDWIEFWYSLKEEQLLHQHFYSEYLFSGIFKNYNIAIKKEDYPKSNKLTNIKQSLQPFIPNPVLRMLHTLKKQKKTDDINNTFYLYNALYNCTKEHPFIKDYKINNIHALYLLQNLKNSNQL